MLHEMPLIATIVAGLGLAFIFGIIAARLKMPPLIGYLFAGILVGPYTPGFVADQGLATELAELGVILLMFGVGLHFSLRDLLSVRAIAVPGAIVQIAFATVLGIGLSWLMGWTLGAGIVFGLALSVASTVVLLRALQERRIIETERGRIAVGWLIVEDLAMVMALVLLPALAGVLGGNDAASSTHHPASLVSEYLGGGLMGAVLLTMAKVGAFVALMLIVGRKVIPWILHYVAHTGSRELFRLAVLAIALGVAYGAAQLFDVSLALGAFFAGMIMSESELSHQAAEESLPLRDAFSVLFFVSVGMLFDPFSLIESPVPILATLFIIVIGKSLAAFLIVLAFGHPVATALVISASLAQIGEFSFILAELGVSLGLLPEQGRDLILAGAILSIVLNPLVFAAIDRLRPWMEKRSAAAAPVAAPPPPSPDGDPAPPPPLERVDLGETPANTPQVGHTIVVGYGRVGNLVGKALRDAGSPLLVIEDSDKAAERIRRDGIEAIAGNAARTDVLEAANPLGAKRIIIAIPNAFEAGPIVTRAKAANPAIRVIARAHSDAEVDHLAGLGADLVIMGEREIARGMVAQVLGTQPADAREPGGDGSSATGPDEPPAIRPDPKDEDRRS